MKQSEKWKRGLPYVGNKGQKAEKIIDILPARNRLIDVFGGGGSISLTAASSGKWNAVVYNDRRETVVNLLKELIEDKPHFDLMKYVYMPREEFYKWRDEMPDSAERTLILLAWSFGNDMHNYVWSSKSEEWKLNTSRAILSGDSQTGIDDLYEWCKGEKTIAGKNKILHQYLAKKTGKSGRNEGLERLQQLERIQHIENTCCLEKIKYSTSDYRKLDIGNEDIVYCDPPYIGTGESYGGFCNEAFQKWLSECPAKEIYISEYTELPNTEVAFVLGKKNSFKAQGRRSNELLLKYVK